MIRHLAIAAALALVAGVAATPGLAAAGLTHAHPIAA